MDNKQQYSYSENLQPQFPLLPPGTFSPNANGAFNDLYTTLVPQNTVERPQNKPLEVPCMFAELPAWDNIKVTEKNDLVEISNKDLSPINYYSNNIEPIIDVQYNRIEGAQWANNFTSNYSSCAQVGKSYTGASKSNYSTSVDKETYKSCAYYNTNAYYMPGKQTDGFLNHYNNFNGHYDQKYLEENNCFSQNSALYGAGLSQTLTNNYNYLPNLDQTTEASNDESDIIVEDSSSECSGDEQQFYNKTKCLVCSTQYTQLGLQFYVLTSKNPLTMSSQMPVKNKISEFIKNNIFSCSDKNYLCNDCLGLVNTIDHLQLKLNNLINDLLNKFNSCSLRNTIKKKKKIQFIKYKCKKCNKFLCVKNYLKKHIKKHKITYYLCESCGLKISSLKKFKTHLKMHRKPALLKAFVCSCKKTFSTKFHLTEHRNFCLGLLPFKCKAPHCNKKFASSTKLKSHTKLKHDKKFVAICSICNIGFVKISNYKSHMISHSTDKKFSCNKCEKSYKTLSNLNFHLKSHKNALPYFCSICNKGFMRKEYHEAHMNNHKGIKNFNCSLCDKKFVSQKNLDAHLKYHEGTTKTNTCNICRKIFTSNFEEHLRVHLNLKEFECTECDMKFNTKNTLSKHRKRKHKQNVNNVINKVSET
ncbi:unnamed protein product [Ceutorhynchus assimilis]|uniref:C2H2-type domain-containing protein n=1 Tax=Ceutorhynchus assimilis TaxID=467358 RepID=A0A9N9QLA3_9CUCU|nr:unnamed protein product [Ceutorhynchus assimilis]